MSSSANSTTPLAKGERARRSVSNQSSRTKRTRAHRRSPETTTGSSGSSSEPELPTGVDEHTELELRQAAARNGLTADMVKNILKKVCRNDHVLALVKLKEEAEEQLQQQHSSKHLSAESRTATAITTTKNAACDDKNAADVVANESSRSATVLHSLASSFVDDIDASEDVNTTGCETIDDDDDDDEDDPGGHSKRSPIKLTRAKARALNKQPLPILPLLSGTVVHQPPPEIARIITTELRSDDEDDDEEYQPGDDDGATDDEFNVTFSDLESHPATPASVWDTSVSLSSPPDATFKVPQRIGSRAASRAAGSVEATKKESSSHADYIIAQQTRSKVSLETTPIEIIESNFQPPDEDAEYMDCSITSEYMQFLKDTISDDPINAEEDDVDDDEDFQLPNSNTPFADREEMYNPPIPQQECLDLFDDLLDHIDNKQMNSHPELQTLMRQLDEPQELGVSASATENPLLSTPTTNHTNDDTLNATLERQRSYNWKSRYANRLFRHLATEPPPVAHDYGANNDDTFADWQLALLEQQLRMHVQLATQSFLQVYGHPGNDTWQFADTFKGFLTDLSAHDAADVRIENLAPACELVQRWELDRSQRNKENRGFVRYLDYHAEQSKRVAASGGAHFFFFHPLVCEVMLRSSGVFMYTHLLPAAPFRLDRRGNFFHFDPTDEFLIALGLERYYEELRKAKLDRRKRCKTRSTTVEVSLNSVCRRIETEMLCWRRILPNAVYRYVVRRRNQKDRAMNPIQYFFKHQKAPGIKHVLHPITANERMPIIERDPQTLSKEWRTAAEKVAALPIASSTLRPSTASNPPHSGSQQQLQVACANCSHISDLNASVLVDNSAQQIGTRTIQSADGPIVITTIVCSVLNEQDLPGTVFSPFAAAKYVHRLHSVRVFGNVLGRFLDPVRQQRHRLAARSHRLAEVYASLVSLDVYVYLWHLKDHRDEMIDPTTDAPLAESDAATPAASVAQPVAAPVVTSSTPTTASSSFSKKMPAWKTPAAAAYKVLVDADSPDETNERDTIFAQNFLDRVEALYSAAAPKAGPNGSPTHTAKTAGGSAPPPPDRYAEFLRILGSFDQRSASAVDLYARCEAFFLPDHPELAQIFLAFLLPADAARLGRFIEHNILQNMSLFVGKLTVYFQKQPAQMRKILGALNELADEERPATLTIDRIRGKIVPMLRGNALLIEWFQQCFASDSMGGGEGANDYEAVAVPKSGADFFSTAAQLEGADGADGGSEAFEEIAAGDLLADPTDPPCHIRYMNGHIFYGSKIVLPVQLSFQTVQYSSVVVATAVPNAAAANEEASDSASDDGRYECAHEIKRIGDRKLDTLFSVPEDVPEVAAADAGGDPAGDETPAAQLQAVNAADKCCNDVILRAHSMRLNPTLHAMQLRKNGDMLELLKRPAMVAMGGGEKSGSPKKRCESAAAVNNAAASPPRKYKLKRLTKTTNRKAVATKPQPPAAPAAQQPSASPRPAATAEPTMCIPIVIKSDFDNDDDDASAAAANCTADEQPAFIDEQFAAKAEPNAENHATILWTRDEDKIVLEQIKCGFTSAEELVTTLFFSGHLPHRSAMEIRDRFTFLMDIINNL